MSELTFNGKVLTVEELQAKMAEFKLLQGLHKEAKKAGLIAKTVRKGKEKSANYNLLASQFSSVVASNTSLIGSIFAEFDGQDSISFDISPEYHVIIRSKKVVRAKNDERKAKKAAAK